MADFGGCLPPKTKQGLVMYSRLMKALSGVACGAAMLALSANAGVANAQELSEKSVRVLMNYAWAILPPKFTKPNNEVIKVDKTKRKEVEVPLDVARKVIEVARLSAFAQICELPNVQAANYRTMMLGEEKKKKWTEQQMLYISQLHLFTVMWLTGGVKLVEKNGGKKVVLSDKSSKKRTQTCTDVERKKVTKQVLAYVCKNKFVKIEGCPK